MKQDLMQLVFYGPRKPNLSRNELKSINKLKKKEDITLLPENKGNATVVIDTATYVSKAEELLRDEAYRNFSLKKIDKEVI